MRPGKVLILFAVLLALLSGAAAAAELPEETAAEENVRYIYMEERPAMLSSAPAVLSLTEDVYEQAYNAILTALRDLEEEIDMSSYGLSVDDGLAIYYDVHHNEPELFYLGGARYGYKQVNGVEVITIIYQEYVEDKLDEKAVFDAKVEQIMDEVLRDGMTDLEKALAFHDYLVDNCAYAWTIPSDPYDPVYSAYGAIVNGEAVCQGYTMAYKLFLNRVGIESGTALSEAMNHTWNVVCLDGEWYHVDVTWDDPVPDREGWGRYDFFLVSDDTLKDDVHRHYGWDETAYTCDSTKYENGYIFNDAIDLVHYYAGEYYCISKWQKLYVGSLSDAQALPYELPHNIYSSSYISALWNENILYLPEFYFEWLGDDYIIGLRLGRFDIITGDYAAISEAVEFVQAASPDGKYDEIYDAVGLRISEDGTMLEAVSSTRREAILSAEIKDHPVAWDKLTLGAGEDARLAGVFVNDNKLHAGALFSGSVSGQQKLIAAFYRDGQMTESFVLYAEAEKGLVLSELSGVELEPWDEARLFLLDANSVPLCECWSSAA